MEHIPHRKDAKVSFGWRTEPYTLANSEPCGLGRMPCSACESVRFEGPMLVRYLGVGRAVVAEAMCSDTRELIEVREGVALELDGRGNRFVGLGFDEPVYD